MTAIVFLRTDTDDILFSEELRHVPQVGDLVTYAFGVDDRERNGHLGSMQGTVTLALRSLSGR